MKHLEDFEKAIASLEEVLALEKSAIHRDSAIKRFELCFELCWKSIKIYARHQGIECNSPRFAFKTAFQLGLIDYNEEWLKMIDDRNLTAHIYKEEYAEKVYLRLPNYTGLFNKLLLHLKKENE
ncbi:nucleotidyltransferase substrate binding protein [bacterium]|nr:nucleotidyltransferase substrate binding protein [bacterium]MBU1599547.1 nucleotidyltransferase substrate binding protein [bacterium]MBU2461907.1 nucleotidyltransferase substrate binding protein [bacterium]